MSEYEVAKMSVRRRVNPTTAVAAVVANDDHPWYQPTPREGWYYCPHQSCTVQARFRTPEDYRTHIDRHLRAQETSNDCRWPGCDFSTTGGLWQHEKQAHNMLESGNFPCPFDGCRRSSVDRAFHRKWDVRNHLTTVHRYSGPFRWTGPFFPWVDKDSQHSLTVVPQVPPEAVAEIHPQLRGEVVFEVRPCRIVIAITFVVTTFSLFLSLYWATIRKDVSGGFTMGGYFIAVESLAIFLFYSGHHAHCHCFLPVQLPDPPGVYER